MTDGFEWDKVVLVKRTNKATDVVTKTFVGRTLEVFGDYTMCIDKTGEIHMVANWKLRPIELEEEI